MDWNPAYSWLVLALLLSLAELTSGAPGPTQWGEGGSVSERREVVKK